MKLSSAVDRYLDNKDVITRITNQKDYDYDFTQNLKSDWHIMKHCATMLITLSNTMTLTHMKGHQDGNIQYKSLDVLSKLNVDGDILAGAV
eukprot:1994719-Ditylum_brightwellii.AAC.1